MSALFGEATSFLDKYLIGAAIGAAIGEALRPEVQDIENTAWRLNQSKPLEAGDVAAIVAENVELLAWGEDEAANTGIDQKRFDALVGEALNAPGLGELYTLLRRGDITAADFTHGLRKAKMETRWDTALAELKNARLTPAQIALGVVRSVINDPGWLVKPLDTSDSNVPQYTPLDLDAVKEAAAAGYDFERMRGLVGEIGLPMSAQQAASAVFRGIITQGAYNQAILEGDTRPEWAPYILDQARQIPSATNFVENHLRGYSSADDMNNGAARHGMSVEDTNLLFQNAGRPLVVHQITTGLARGGVFHPNPTGEQDPFQASVHESDIKPEYYDLAIANRYTYPGAFVLRSMAQSGELTPAEVHDTLLKLGWEPGFAQKVTDAWTAPSAGASKEATATDLLTLYDGGRRTEAETVAALESLGYPASAAQDKVDLVHARRVASAKGTAITDIHAKYKKLEIDAAVAQTAIESLGVSAWAALAIVEAWGAGVGAVEPT